MWKSALEPHIAFAFIYFLCLLYAELWKMSIKILKIQYFTGEEKNVRIFEEFLSAK